VEVEADQLVWLSHVELRRRAVDSEAWDW